MIPLRWRAVLFTVALAAAPAEASDASAPAVIRVTSGKVDALAPGRYRVDGSMRATSTAAYGGANRAAEVAFTYDGPSTRAVPLASGELRRQIGLKLRAADTCNVVYVMWHVEPSPRVAVSVKRNPGASTHAECGARGYINVRPRANAAAARVLPGTSHVLAAELRGRDLRVLADGALAWEGTLPDDALAFDGPAGLRTDNGRFEFALRVAR